MPARRSIAHFVDHCAGPQLYKTVNAGEVREAINTRYLPTACVLLQDQHPNVQIIKPYEARFSDIAGIGISKK
jgi:hypothetical protein